MATFSRAIAGARTGRLSWTARSGGDRDARAAGPGECLAPISARHKNRTGRGANNVVANATAVEGIGVIQERQHSKSDACVGDDELHYGV